MWGDTLAGHTGWHLPGYYATVPLQDQQHGTLPATLRNDHQRHFITISRLNCFADHLTIRHDDESVANDGDEKNTGRRCLTYVLLHGQLGVELDAQISNNRGRDDDL